MRPGPSDTGPAPLPVEEVVGLSDSMLALTVFSSLLQILGFASGDFRFVVVDQFTKKVIGEYSMVLDTQ